MRVSPRVRSSIVAKIDDLPDLLNANRGTDRGRAALRMLSTIVRWGSWSDAPTSAWPSNSLTVALA